MRRGQQAPWGFLWEAQALEERSYHMLRKEREKGHKMGRKKLQYSIVTATQVVSQCTSFTTMITILIPNGTLVKKPRRRYAKGVCYLYIYICVMPTAGCNHADTLAISFPFCMKQFQILHVGSSSEFLRVEQKLIDVLNP